MIREGERIRQHLEIKMNEINDDKNQFEEQEQEKMKMETKLKEKDVMIDKLIKQINQNIENRKLEQKGVP